MITQILRDNMPEGLDFTSDKIFGGFVENDGIGCITNQAGHESFQKLAKTIADTFNPSSVLEFGSGAGDMSCFIRSFLPEVEYASVDINKKAASSPYYKGPNSYHFIAYTDMPLQFVDAHGSPMKFDLILSMEHFEHISPNTFDILLKNIKRHMKPETVVVSTAANFGRDDNVHINMRTKSEWYQYLEIRGFKMLEMGLITTENQPFNIQMQFNSTHELVFKLK